MPRNLRENLEWRGLLYKLGNADEGWAKLIQALSARDPLFWINSWAWAVDPRKAGRSLVVTPFATYPYQDHDIPLMLQCLGVRDVVHEKSRDMGASWVWLLLFLHRFMFGGLCSFLLMSRTEALVDTPDDPDSLFWKIEYTLGKQPPWIFPRRSWVKTALKFANKASGGVIRGSASVADVGRGGRPTAIFLDEFASFAGGDNDVMAATADATDCRIMNSTPKGNVNRFCREADAARFNQSSARLFTWHWSLHPVKATGLYFDHELANKWKTRSPWYDAQCKRRTPEEIAQELDIDYRASNSPFFPGQLQDRLLREHARPPLRRGNLIVDMEAAKPLDFEDSALGSWKLWIHPDEKGRITKRTLFGMGCDVSYGTGATPSVIEIGDRRTGEKVAEYVNASLDPKDCARIAVAAARWFAGEDEANGGAFMCWETPGPGLSFGAQVLELGYRHIFYRKAQEFSLNAKSTDTPGWHSNPYSKNALLDDFRAALTEDRFLDRSEECIKELTFYIFDISGNIQSAKAKAATDFSGARQNHGDRVMGSALLWLTMKEMSTRAPDKAEPVVQAGSIAWFRKRREDAKREVALEGIY